MALNLRGSDSFIAYSLEPVHELTIFVDPICSICVLFGGEVVSFMDGGKASVSTPHRGVKSGQPSYACEPVRR